jgi:hypothetical protein
MHRASQGSEMSGGKKYQNWKRFWKIPISIFLFTAVVTKRFSICTQKQLNNRFSLTTLKNVKEKGAYISQHNILFYWYSGRVAWNWVHSAMRPLIGLLCQPRVIMIMEKLVEWLAEETEVLRKNLAQFRFFHHKPHMLHGRERGPLRWEASV